MAPAICAMLLEAASTARLASSGPLPVPSATDWMSAIGTDLGAIGTVGALIFLAIQARRLGQQTSELHRQNEAEAEARRQDTDRRRAEFRSEHTPFLSVEAGKVSLVRDAVMPGLPGIRSFLGVGFTLHADGAGVAHNVIVNFLQVADPPPHRHVTTKVVPLIRAPGQHHLTLECPPNLAADETQWFQLEVRFLNMFNESVGLTHSARFREGNMEITDAPTYEWPWSFP